MNTKKSNRFEKPTWKQIATPAFQASLTGRCQLHRKGFAHYEDPHVPEEFFNDIHLIAAEVATMVDGVDGVTVFQAKEKWGTTQVYASSSKETKMVVLGTWKDLNPSNDNQQITQPLGLHRAFELMRRKYPQYAHYVGEYASLENPCKCKDGLSLCRRYAKYFGSRVRRPKESPIAWDLIRLLPGVDTSTREKAIEVTAEFREQIAPFQAEMQKFRQMLVDREASMDDVAAALKNLMRAAETHPVKLAEEE